MFQTFESLIRTLRTLVPDFTPAQNPDRPKFANKNMCESMVEPISASEPNSREFWNRFGCGFLIYNRWFFICKRAVFVSAVPGVKQEPTEFMSLMTLWV